MLPLWERVNDALARQGFVPATRSVVIRTAGCGLLCVLTGIVMWAFGRPAAGGVFWFGVAALFSSWNFWALAKLIHQRISNGWSKNLAARLILGTHIRLFLTGIFVYSAFMLGKASLFVLLGGLSLSMFFVIISGCFARGK